MNQHKNNLDKILWGLLLIIGAAALILNRLGFWPLLGSISVFDVIFTIWFVWLIISGIRHFSFYEIIFGIALLGILYDEQLGIESLTPWTLLGAALLLSIGLSMIFGRFHHSHHSHGPHIDYTWNGSTRSYHIDSEHGTATNTIYDEDSASHNSDANSDSLNFDKTYSNLHKDAYNQNYTDNIYPCDEFIDFDNNFGSGIKYVNTDRLVSGKLDNSFGQMKVYFDNTTMKNGIADITVDVSFGKMILYIPKTWKVNNYIHATFGGMNEINLNASNGSPVLNLYGDVAFGALEIFYI